MKTEIVTRELTANGICFDFDGYTNEFYADLTKNYEEQKEKLFDEVGRQFDLDNRDEIASILSGYYLDPKGQQIDDFLEANQYRDNTIQLLYHVRRAKHDISAYAPEKLKAHMDSDSRIHANWEIKNYSTGRLTCSEPALQSLPRAARKYMVPEAGNVFVTVDYSTIELRVLAKLANDPYLIADLGKGSDIHRRTASRIFCKEPEEITDDERQIGKQVNFMIAYGATPRGMADRISSLTDFDVSTYETEIMIYRFFEAYPLVYYYQYKLKRYRSNPVTLMGKEFSDDLNINQRLNYPVQGSAAEGFLQTLCKLVSKKPAEYQLVMAIHDSITLEVPARLQDKAADFLQNTAESVMGKFLDPVPVFTELKYCI